MHADANLHGFLQAMNDPALEVENLSDEASRYASALINSPPGDWDRILPRLSEAARHECPLRAGIIANVAGALVERGAGPQPLASELLKRLPELIAGAQQFQDACLNEVQHEPRPDDIPAGEEYDPADDYDAFHRVVERMSDVLSDQARAWQGLEMFHTPVVAALSTDPDLRRQGQHLVPALRELAGHHGGADWILKLLLVLDKGPVVVLEPGAQRGLLGTISGISDNFQLHMLLMDTLPAPGLLNWLGGGRLPKDLAALARGQGPQQLDHPVTGRWNLYNWQALDSRGLLPDPGDYKASSHWIWNEGMPADIAVFEGRRVILLGPPAYPRSWNACRLFAQLPAEIVVEEKLAAGQVKEWIERLAGAKH